MNLFSLCSNTADPFPSETTNLILFWLGLGLKINLLLQGGDDSVCFLFSWSRLE